MRWAGAVVPSSAAAGRQGHLITSDELPPYLPITLGTMTISSDTTRNLKPLKRALIEIRASNNLEKAKVIADIFHNVPMSIVSRRFSEEIEDSIMMVARRHDVEDHIRL